MENKTIKLDGFSLSLQTIFVFTEYKILYQLGKNSTLRLKMKIMMFKVPRAWDNQIFARISSEREIKFIFEMRKKSVSPRLKRRG